RAPGAGAGQEGEPQRASHPTGGRAGDLRKHRSAERGDRIRATGAGAGGAPAGLRMVRRELQTTRDQGVGRWISNRGNGKIDIKKGPVEAIWRRPLNRHDLLDGGLPKPRKVLERKQ